MNTPPRSFVRTRNGLASVALVSVCLGACSSTSNPPAGTGGTTGTGGVTATGGTTSTGGSTSTGGTTSTGGSTSTGGVTSTGGSSGGQGGSKGGAGGAPRTGGNGGQTSTGGSSPDGGTPDGSAGTIVVTSTAYTEGSMIPAANTCAGADTSPPLAWTGAPSTTKSFTVVLRDMTGNILHWVLWDVPGTATSLPAMIDETSATPSNVPGAHQALGFGGSSSGFTGPCPMTSTHTYRFTVYAIPTDKLTTGNNPKAADIEMAAIKQAIATGELSGTSNAKKP